MSKPYYADDPLKSVTFFKNPATGKAALYFLFELEPDHVYRFDVTTDGQTWDEVRTINTKGFAHEVYHSWNVPDPCEAIWPRVVDLGPSPT